MPAAYQNLYIEQGTSFSTTITLDDVYGDIYDLTGYTANSQIRKSYYSSNATAAFLAIVDANTGTVSLSMSTPTTANIAAGRDVYDTIIKTPAGDATRILEGVVDVSPSVTRS
jgi:hypothetical protein